jgi:outer membrane protein OmpA-like peptidoglycan-associated protein
MKTKTIINNSRQGFRSLKLVTKGIVLSALIMVAIQAPLHSQDTYTRPSWFFGVAGGANLNYYQGSTQNLNSDLFVPKAFLHGGGVGLYLAPLIEYYRPNTRLGFMFQAGYDQRSGSFDQVTTPCNCPADLFTGLSYLTLEPSLRLAPFKSNFYLYAGPRVAFNLDKSFTYKLGVNPLYPDQTPTADVDGDFSEVENILLSMQIGAGYDIFLSSQDKKTQWVVSPFVSFQPYFGQNPRSVETWTLTTVRVGAAIKLGRGTKTEQPVTNERVEPVAAEPEVKFTVYSPANLPQERRVSEIIPILNYVFFEVNSNEIPARYVLLTKQQVDAGHVGELSPEQSSGRSAGELDVYYNVLNILGDRMSRFPSAKVTLTGSTLKGANDGKVMAEKVKSYLVSVFGIAPSRITTTGGLKPTLSSESTSGTRELALLRQEDNRVSISSESPEIHRVFRAEPLEMLQVAPVDSYVTFNVVGADKAFKTWSLEIKDDKGIVKKFGPFTGESQSIPGEAILGTTPAGNYKVTMFGETKSGKTVKKDASFAMKLWTATELKPGLRYSVIYGFDQSTLTPTYVKYLTDAVTPEIPRGAQVNLSGYTDVIGDADNNKLLSIARATDVKVILEKALAKAGRTDVTFVSKGVGENDNLSPFNNNFPEERFYNRCVIIEVVPMK